MQTCQRIDLHEDRFVIPVGFQVDTTGVPAAKRKISCKRDLTGTDGFSIDGPGIRHRRLAEFLVVEGIDAAFGILVDADFHHTDDMGVLPVTDDAYRKLAAGQVGFDQRRLVDYAAIAVEYARLADEDQGLLTAEIVAASDLDERRRDRLRRALSDRTGREVRLEIQVDPSLVGGAIAKVGDLVFDGSIRTQLQHLRSNLLGEGSSQS